MIDRERSRSHLVLAALLIIVSTLALPQADNVYWPGAFVAVASIAATWFASLLPALWPMMNHVGGILIAAEIFGLVLATGGTDSPYSALYAMLLLYAAVFYGTRRLLLTGGIITIASAAPYVSSAAANIGPERVEMIASLAVWAVTAAVVHGLVRQLRERTRQYAEQEQRYRSLFDHNPNPVYSLDRQGRFTSVNAAACGALGYREDQLVGRSHEMVLVPDEVPADRVRVAAALERHPQIFETRVVDRQGRRLHLAASKLPIVVDDEVVGLFGVAQDISEVKALQEALTQQALHDTLTGLPNRVALSDRIEHALADTARSGKQVSLLMLDLDGFKQVNDTLGHAAGDALLVEVAALLRRCIRPGDTAARLGGDEFVVVLPAAEPSDAQRVAERILHELREPVTLVAGKVTVAGSVGIAVAAAGDGEASQLLREADQAMYAAKRSGRGRYAFFGEQVRCLSQDR